MKTPRTPWFLASLSNKNKQGSLEKWLTPWLGEAVWNIDLDRLAAPEAKGENAHSDVDVPEGNRGPQKSFLPMALTGMSKIMK